MQENTDSLSETEKKLRSLQNMGYTVDEAAIAMERCGAYIKSSLLLFTTLLIIILFFFSKVDIEKLLKNEIFFA